MNAPSGGAVVMDPPAAAPAERPERHARVPAAGFGRSVLAVAAALALLACGALVGVLAGGSSQVAGHGLARGAGAGSVTLSRLPEGAQASLSAALGGSDPAYRVAGGAGGFRALNPAQGMRLRYSADTAFVSSGSVAFALSLQALGEGRHLAPAGGARASASANRLSVQRAGVREWYLNGPLGIEQGFTVSRAAGAGSTLTLSLGLSGRVRPVLSPDRTSLTVRGAGASALRYGPISATDAAGRTLPSRLELRPGGVLLRVDLGGARLPVRIDPLIQQAELVPAGARGLAHVGRSVALSADGNTALVGAPRTLGGAGDVSVFVRSGSTWSEQATLNGHELAATAFFGRAVALSASGDVALIGDPGASANSGDAWVFTRSGTNWTPQQRITGSEEVGEGSFGRSVALSESGETALVGGFGDAGNVGAAWVFQRGTESWAQQGAKLTAPLGEEAGGGQFGWSVSISGDGATALIGAPVDAARHGAAWVFARSGESWLAQGPKLTGSGEEGSARFGSAVSLDGSGATALIGGVHDAAETGAAWIFVREGSAWSEDGQKLTGTGAAPPSAFGTSAALSADGSTALIGGLADNADAGAAWVFKRAGSSWQQQGAKLAATEEEGAGQFGWSVALAANGATGLVGGIANAGGAGAAWVFSEAPEPVEPVEPVEPKTGGGAGNTSSTSSSTTTTTTQSPGSGGVASFIISTNPNVAAPVLGQSGNLSLVSGTVLIKLPGSGRFVALKGTMHIPFGTIIDATHGQVTVVTMGRHGIQVGRYFGGEFLLTQQSNGVVVATLEGGSFAKCSKTGKHASVSRTSSEPAAATARSRRPVRKLWTNAHGSFTTKGTYAAGAVQGTEWLTEDFCGGTLIVVTRDRVKVTDLVHHRHVLVRAGHRYFA